MANKYKTSVIIPVYNESFVIEQTLSAVIDFVVKNPDFYFLFVNDGSTDNSAEIISEKIKGVTGIGLLDNKKNVGKAGAIKSALTQLDSDNVCFIDGDLAYSLDHLHKLVESLKDNDVAIGSRRLSESILQPVKANRAIAGEAFNRLARYLLGLPYRDTQAGVKGFRQETAKRLFGLARINDFAFDAELLYIARIKGLKVGQIPARVSESHTKYPSTVKVLRDSPGMFFSLVRIVFNGMTGKYNE